MGFLTHCYFACTWDPFSPGLPRPALIKFVPNLLVTHYVWLISLGDLHFSEGKWRRNGSGEEGRWEKGQGGLERGETVVRI